MYYMYNYTYVYVVYSVHKSSQVWTTMIVHYAQKHAYCSRSVPKLS